MWSIRVLSGQQAGQIYDLRLGKNVFGRGGVSDLKVQSLGISKEHCEIHVYKDKMMIVDLKSSNGTFVNGVKIQNSIVRVGDKISLFDVIMDVIPAPDIRPKSPPKQAMQNPPVPMQRPPAPPVPLGAPQMNYPQQGGAAMQMGYQQAPQMYQTQNQFGQQNQQPQQAAEPQLTLAEKVENYVENVVMPAIYRLGILFSFKQILQGFVIIFIFSVTLLSTIPLTSIVKESNLKEATKRAKSVARAMAKFNEQALLSGQLGNLSVNEAMKEEGIKEAFIIQQSDGLIVAPPEKAGRDGSNPLVLTARKESRAAFAQLDSSTIGASFPIAIYDPSSGEATPKYHAIVTYDIGSLNIDEGRIISLFMQTLIISSVLGLILYYLFARLIEFPIRTLNLQIDKALIDKSDRTEVAFDYPVFQKLVSNVNTILNRAWSGESGGSSQKPQQNKDLEFSNLVEMISHPVIVVDADQRVVAVNGNFEQLAQTSKDAILNQTYQSITDNALVQNIDALVARSKQSPYEKQMDKIPFSQFECEIFCQAFLNADGEPQYFILTLVQLAG
ncbi:MAG: FHA domain-containing protein [Pseudobdellovibrio sp.]